MTTLPYYLLVGLGAVSVGVGPTLGAVATDPEDVTIEWLQEVFEGAYVTTEIDADGDLVLREAGSTTGWLHLDRKQKTLNFLAIGGFRRDCERGERLEFVNELNNNVMGATFYVMSDSLLVADSYVFYEAGISDKQIVHVYQRFRDALLAAIGRDTNDLLH
jgi:hypothetical protein